MTITGLKEVGRKISVHLSELDALVAKGQLRDGSFLQPELEHVGKLLGAAEGELKRLNRTIAPSGLAMHR